MDQHEPDNDLHIPVDTPPKLNVHKTFCEVYDVLLTGFVGSVKVVCPLGSRNISKLTEWSKCTFSFQITHTQNQ